MFKGKKVLITGGTGKIGSRLAFEFVKQGAKVVICYNKSKKKAASISKSTAGLVKVDCTKIGEIKNAVLKAAKILGGMDILINSAGIFYKTPISKTTPTEFDSFVNVNLRAPYFFIKFAHPFLKKSKAGRVVNISDIYGLSPSATYVPYGVSRAGLIAMTKGLAKELAPEVLVNSVAPGVVIFKKGDKKRLKKALLRRAVSIDNVISAIKLLASTRKITGRIITVLHPRGEFGHTSRV